MADLTVNYFNVMANFDSTWERYPLRYVHIHSVEDSTVGGDWLLDNENKVADTEGINLTAGEWEIWYHGAVVDPDTEELVTRITTERKVIKVLPTGNAGGVMPIIPESNVEQITALAEEAVAIAQSVRDDADDGDFNGATFYPTVNNDGDISWTNDKDLPNPATKNIKGPKGDTGAGVPTGGTVGQAILRGEDNTTVWGDIAPKNHASTGTTYGTGTSSNYGHLKLSDATDNTSDTTGGTAATPKAVKSAMDTANNKVSKTGDTMTGTLLVDREVNNGAGINIRSEGLTDGTTVSTTNWGTNLQFSESTPSNIGSLYPVFRTDGKQGMAMRSRRTIGGSYNDNYLEIGKDDSGKSYVILESPKAWKEALGVINPNLLDNWYFCGNSNSGQYGILPVNQRSQGTYSGSAQYTVDRWKMMYGADQVSTSSTGLLIVTGGTHGASDFILEQSLPNTQINIGVPYTVSILVSGIAGTWAIYAGSRSTNSNRVHSGYITTTGLHTVTGTFSDDISDLYFEIRLYGSTGGDRIRIEAVKFEMGDTQTLAHLENGTWVLNEIPNYADELRKCQAYFVRFKNSSSSYAIHTTMLATSATNARGLLPLPVPMSKAPTISISGTVQLGSANLGSGYPVTSLSIQSLTQTSLIIGANVASGLTAGQFYFLRNNDNINTYFDLSAE